MNERENMKDREFLLWLHDHLEHVHGESPFFDYMHKLRAIIRNTPEDQVSVSSNTGKGLDDLRRIKRSN